MRIVVREGNWVVGVLCAVTRAGFETNQDSEEVRKTGERTKPRASITASTIPAVKDEQLS
jgi:hypothetical protein